jgi:hypothetical protein
VKSKFLGMIVTVAVVLGLLAVPAIAAPPTSPACWLEVDPVLTKVGFNTAFDVNITFQNPNATDIATVMCHLNYTASLVEVTGVDYGATVGSPFTLATAAPTWDNTTGWLDYDAGAPLGTTTNVTSCVYATVHMKSKGATGIADIAFTPVDSYGDPETAIVDTSAGDHTDWALIVNGTVKCGAPQLTVDVVPDGKGTVEANSVLLTGDPNTTAWAWDEVVNLEAIESTAGWEFDSWTGTDNNGVNPTTVTMTDAKSVTANFVEKPPILDVDPNLLELSARWGGFDDNGTVTISNDGGGTLCWAVGDPPVWAVNDWWNYANVYQPFPALPIPGSNMSFVNISVTSGGAGSDYQTTVAIAPPLQRSMMGGMPCVLYSGTATFDEYTLDMVEQIGQLGIYPYGLPPAPEVPVQANLSWAYDGCHGWPYYAGKSWNYNLTMEVRTADGNWSPVDYKVIPAMAMVTGWNSTYSAWEIAHLALPNMTAFMQTYWSPAVKNFVLQADGGTYDFPPMDIRSLAGFSTAAPPAGPPSWLSFDKTHGALGIGGSEVLTVTANSSGLNVSTYSTSFTISAPGSVQSETVAVNFTVTPATTIDVFRDLPADALDYDAERPGDKFQVYVNFSAPVADFNSISLTDFAPPGWLVETDNALCNPVASWNKSNYNKAEYSWAGPFDPPQNFTAVYNVTIPATASAGINEWPACLETGDPCGETSNINSYSAWVEYWFGADGPHESSICGDYQKIVTVPGCVRGETRDVNADLLDTVTVVLYEEPLDANPEDSDASVIVPTPVNWTDAGGNFTTRYENCADDTGYYYQVASKYCYNTIATDNMTSPRNVPHPDYIDWSTPTLLAAGYRMDFEGDYGLICKGADMSYAMESVNHWLFVPIDQYAVPHPEWQLHSWKAMESIHSWQYPCGCGCI